MKIKLAITALLGIMLQAIAIQASEMPKTLLEMAGAKQQAARLSDSVLVIIDEQREYVDGKLPLSGINNAIRESAKLLERARKSGTPVIHVVHNGRKGGGLFNPDEKFVEIVAPLTPVNGEQIVVKSLPDAFAGTSLEEFVQRTGRKELIVIGFMTHLCVSSTVRAASSRGYKTTVVASATATRDLPGVGGGVIHAADVQQASLAALADRFAVVVAGVDEIN